MKNEGLQGAALVVPCARYLESYLEACRGYKATGITYYMFHDPDTFDDWKDTIFDRFEKNRRGEDLPPGYVPASIFWLVSGDQFIGSGSIRHRLTPTLERFGGHIGYGIRPDCWRQGYGTAQLSLLLPEAQKLGIDRALITCDETNIGSARVIEKNGGVWQDTIDNVIEGEKRRTKRYWVHTAR